MKPVKRPQCVVLAACSLAGSQPKLALRDVSSELGYHLGYHCSENAPDEHLVRGVSYLVVVVGPAGIEPAT